jgi:hypothetical protein
MIGAISVLVMATLFVVFGLLRIGKGGGCGGDHCDSCSHDCDIGSDVEAQGRLP